MAVVICGSLAFDHIMRFEGRFAEQILPDQLHILNVSFLVPSLRREYGGCAGNIAYSLQQLGGQALPLATLGKDGQDYLQRLKSLGISTELVHEVADDYTAQAMIMTDQDNNQITAFHPGAMARAHQWAIPANANGSGPNISLGIVSPDGRQAMLEHAQQLHAARIPFVFDPGQGLPMFNGQELQHFITLASWVTVNDYEGRMLCERTGLSLADISHQVQGLVVTLGHQGCQVWEGGTATLVPPAVAEQVIDPTGCGDAFRGALLYGLEKHWPLARCCELGNRVGALKIATPGCQNYRVDGVV